MIQNKKIIVVVPAFNTAKTLPLTLETISLDSVDEIIVINDGSIDATAELAHRYNVVLINHEINRGYGAAQKTGYCEALHRGADVVVMVHSDFQYDPTMIPQIIKPIIQETADACFGSRLFYKKEALRGGMPLWRFIANIALTFVEESVLHLHLSEYHTGYRAYSRRVLERTCFEKNSDNYVFDTEMIAELALGKFNVTEIPIPTRYTPDSQSPNFRKSVIYGFSTLVVLWKFLLHNSGIRQYPQFIIKS